MSGSVVDDATLTSKSQPLEISRHRPTAPAEASARRRATALEKLERGVLQRLLDAVGNPPLAVRLWNGQTAEPSAPQAQSVCLQIHDRATLWKLAIDPLFQFGEAYADGRLQLDGDLADVLTLLYRGWNTSPSSPLRVGRQSYWLHPPRRNTLAGSRDNIHHHYDLGNDFYRLWLDEQLVYTCAYYAEPSYTLEQAQIAKLRHVCRKLHLRAGETVVEAGCGWGALALYMARYHGVRVRAFNISRQQIAHARERAAREGLTDKVEFVLDDWRNINEPCNVFVSIGMLEHVGPANYRRLGRVISRCLGRGGRGLIHSIGQVHPEPLNPWIERRIFPGARAPTLGEIMELLRPHDLAVLDVEDLRPHYALTLRQWRERFERSVETIRAQFGEKFVRMWRLYLCGSQAGFESGALQLFQVLFAKSGTSTLPWTRADIYEPLNDKGR